MIFISFLFENAEKKPLTEEEKKANMNIWRKEKDQTGKAAAACNAFSEKKKAAESEGEYIVNSFKRSMGVSRPDDLPPMSAVNIVMTTAKATCVILLIINIPVTWSG